MLDEQARQGQMAAAQTADLLAPVDLLAIAAPEGGIELRHLPQIAGVHRHAESDPGGGNRQFGIGMEGGRQRIDPVGLAGGQHAAAADHRHAEDLGVVRHRRDRGHILVHEDRPDQPPRPAGRHEGIRVQQHDMVVKARRHLQRRIDRPDEAPVFRMFDQGDAAGGAAVLRGHPAAQEGTHPVVGRGVLDHHKPPRQVGVAHHPVQHLGQQVEGVPDRQHKGDPGLRQVFGHPRKTVERGLSGAALRLRGGVVQDILEKEPRRHRRGGRGHIRKAQRRLDAGPGGRVPRHQPAQGGGQHAGKVPQEGPDQAAAGGAQIGRGKSLQRMDVAQGPGFDTQHRRAGPDGDIEQEAKRAGRITAAQGGHVAALQVRLGLGPLALDHDGDALGLAPALDAQPVAAQGKAVDISDQLAPFVPQPEARLAQVQMFGRVTAEDLDQYVQNRDLSSPHCGAGGAGPEPHAIPECGFAVTVGARPVYRAARRPRSAAVVPDQRSRSDR